MSLIQSTLVEEIVKAINAHDYNFDATVGRDGRIHVTYTENTGRGWWNAQSVNIILKVDG